MKVFLVLRLYSGLEEGLFARAWQPKGIPAVVKLIEKLDCSKHHLDLCFLRRDAGSEWEEGKDYTGNLAGLNSSVKILAGEKKFSWLPGVIRRKLSYLRQVVVVMNQVRKKDPDVVFVDRVNIFIAALLARYTKRRVVWRVLGILPVMKTHVSSKSLRDRFYAWMYRSPFDYVICTKDGSGGERWMEQALRPGVPRGAYINGVKWKDIEVVRQAQKTPDSKTRFLFVGRMEENKGILEFIEAFSLVSKWSNREVSAVLVGDGKYSETIHDYIREQGLTDLVRAVGSVKHNEVLQYYRSTDIYVSLNKGGNLSNSNLEAMAVGVCIIVPKSDCVNNVDTDTDRIFPDDSLYRVKSTQVKDVSEGMMYLHGNPQDRMRRARKIAQIARELLPTWDAKISNDIQILERLG